MKKNLIRFAGIFTLALILMGGISCKKEGDTIGIITVVDSSGNPVTSATVVLWQDTVVNPVTGAQANVRQSKLTGSAGTAEFLFQLEAYLNVSVTKGALTGEGFIRLQQGETVSMTVTIR
jgi:hypothetical protein